MRVLRRILSAGLAMLVLLPAFGIAEEDPGQSEGIEATEEVAALEEALPASAFPDEVTDEGAEESAEPVSELPAEPEAEPASQFPEEYAAEGSEGEDTEAGDFLIDDSGVLTKYAGNGGSVVIPDTVTAIGNEAFMDCVQLTSVVLPEGVTSIGDSAFAGCDALNRIVLPAQSLTVIGKEAFSGCENLMELSVPGSVARIEERTFAGCNRIVLTLEEGVNYLGNFAFEGCGGIIVHLPESLTEIEEKAFKRCYDPVVYVKDGSCAQEFCEKHSIRYRLSDKSLPAITFLGEQDGDTVSDTDFKLHWRAVKGAGSYEIEMSCGRIGKETTANTNSLQINFRKKGFKKADAEVILRVSAYKASSVGFGELLAQGQIMLRPREIDVLPKKVILPKEAKALTLCVSQSFQLEPEVRPAGAQTNFFYSSSKPKVATVDESGLITALVKGSSTVTVETSNGKRASCKVSVKAAPQSATLNPPDRTNLGVGEDLALVLELQPANSYAGATWKSSDEEVAVVDKDGVVTAKGIGSVKITVHPFNLPEQQCELTVHAAPTKENTKIQPENPSVSVGEKTHMTVLCEDYSPTVKLWKSSNKKVATVNRKGIVKGVRKGSATITAVFYNGETQTVRLNVTA